MTNGTRNIADKHTCGNCGRTRIMSGIIKCRLKSRKIDPDTYAPIFRDAPACRQWRRQEACIQD